MRCIIYLYYCNTSDVAAVTAETAVYGRMGITVIDQK